MNTRDLAELTGWDERDLSRTVLAFTRRHRRLPRGDELVALRPLRPLRPRRPLLWRRRERTRRAFGLV